MLQAIFPSVGPTLIAVAIMIAAFGCMNALILSGARAYYAMSLDGLFFKSAVASESRQCSQRGVGHAGTLGGGAVVDPHL